MFDTVTSYDVDRVQLRMEEPINVSIVYNINDCVHIDILIGVGLDKNVQEISEDEFKAGKRIFNDAIEKLGEPSPDPK